MVSRNRRDFLWRGPARAAGALPCHGRTTREGGRERRAVGGGGEAGGGAPGEPAQVMGVDAGVEEWAGERGREPVRREVRGQRGGRLLERGGERTAYVGRVGVGARRRAENGFRHL